jgi:DNA invertase Pin-like site-specific DNA recombinase
MSDKIKAQHLSRKAILYVRQSSAYQVSHNLESQRLQYAMQERLQHLGWREIEVVDEDLGRSAAGLVSRSGFERMVADVCLGKVGAVAAREVSRFARNSREWAAAGRSLPGRRHRSDRSGHGLRATTEQ